MNRSAWIVFALCLTAPALAHGQRQLRTLPPAVPVASLPTCDADHLGMRYQVTDGSTATDCSAGAGATANICECDGASWVNAPIVDAATVTASALDGTTVCGAFLYSATNPTEAGAVDDFLSLLDHAGSTTEANEDDLIANDALLTFHSLRCDIDVAPGAGNDDWRIVVRDDGADTAVTCDIAETATSCSDTSNSAVVAAGSLVNLDVNSDVGAGTDPTAAAVLTCSVCMGP